ncbi:hypothetical protein CIC12_31290 [Burkholderia sp. SG-MS1]|nr:hypothetical protein [Paraburkholderia sp. SG-MS1]
MSIWDGYKKSLKYTSPVSWLLVEGAETAVTSIQSAAAKGIDKLQEEVAKQNLQLQFAQQQARVAQELAIARRIENAEEVEIEEFYDMSGKGNVGLTFDGKSETGTLGVGAEGRRVTKRVYHFKGWKESETQGYVQEPGVQS